MPIEVVEPRAKPQMVKRCNTPDAGLFINNGFPGTCEPSPAAKASQSLPAKRDANTSRYAAPIRDTVRRVRKYGRTRDGRRSAMTLTTGRIGACHCETVLTERVAIDLADIVP